MTEGGALWVSPHSETSYLNGKFTVLRLSSDQINVVEPLTQPDGTGRQLHYHRNHKQK